MKLFRFCFFLLSFFFLIILPVQAQDATPTPLPTPIRPREAKPTPFEPLVFDKSYPKCTQLAKTEFHPLRPYPASPCDPLIPRKVPEAKEDKPNKLYLSFQCGKSANPQGYYTVKDVIDVTGMGVLPTDWNSISLPKENGTRSDDYLCNATSGDICFVKKITANVHLSYRDSQFPVIGNVQSYLEDEAKANNYLSWYLNGTIQQAEQKPLDPTLPEDVHRVINFSGPFKRLFSAYSQQNLRDTLKNGSELESNYRNYAIWPGGTRMASAPSTDANMPFTTLEDMTGEVNVAVVPDQQPKSPEIDGSIFSISLTISAADSRIYFPHMRSLTALSELLAGTFKPHIESYSKNVTPTPLIIPNPVRTDDSGLLAQVITFHQGYGKTEGGNDLTIIQSLPPGIDRLTGKTTRNTEVMEGYLAPPPLYKVPDIRCDLKDTVMNQGDDLVGSVISTVVVYKQMFKYHPQVLVGSPCPSGLSSYCLDSPPYIKENEYCPNYHAALEQCAWGSCQEVQGDKCTFLENIPECVARGGACNYSNWVSCQADPCCSYSPPEYKCPSWPEKDLKSMARISTFTKTPLVDRLYDTLVYGPESFMRRFISSESAVALTAPESTKPGMTGAQYFGDTKDLHTFSVTAGEGGAPAIYFPRLGGIFDHFLGAGGLSENVNLQCLLRPYGYCTSGFVCSGVLDKLTEEGGSCGICKAGAVLGPLAQKILTAAGKEFGVPAANIWVAMWHEGGSWSDFEHFPDDKVREWSIPEWCGGKPMPRCDNEAQATQPPFGFLRNWFYLGDGDGAVWNAVQKIDPTRNSKEKVSRCNFLDAAYAAAKFLRNGSAMWPDNSCNPPFTFDNKRVTSCDAWTDDKIAQSQRAYSGCALDRSTMTCTRCMYEKPYGWDLPDLPILYHKYACN